MLPNFMYLLLLMVAVTLCAADDKYVPKEQELRTRLLQNYDRTTLPDRTTQLTLRRLTIKHIEISEENHSMDVDAWLIYEWTDLRLRFEQTAEINKLSMDPKDIWMPDLRLYNSGISGSSQVLDDTLTLVFPEGRVLHLPQARLHTACIVDLTYWPHDTHNCSIVMGSWIHHGHTLDLRLLEKEAKVELPGFVSNGSSNVYMSPLEWQVLATSITRRENTYECCPEPYVSLVVSILLRRHAPALAWLVKLPVAGLSVLTLMLFLLPPGSEVKVTFGALCLVLDLLFLAYTSNLASHAPSHTPIIVQLVGEQVVVVVVGIVVSVLVVRLVHNPHSSGLPTVIRGPVSLAAYYLCLSQYNNLAVGFRRTLPRSLKSDEVELGSSGGLGTAGATNPHHLQECTINKEWLLLAAVVDRVCLVFCLALYFINLIRLRSVL